MELRRVLLILLIITIIDLGNCQSKSRKGESKLEEECELACEECFTTHDPLQRMGCLEKCVKQGDVENFKCPGRKSFLGVVEKPSADLEQQIEDFFTKRSEDFSAKDVDSIGETFTEYSTLIIDLQIPFVGREARKQKVRDWFEGNPEIVSMKFVPEVFGDENGVIWSNGHGEDYDADGNVLATFRLMSLYTRMDMGKNGTILLEDACILFGSDRGV